MVLRGLNFGRFWDFVRFWDYEDFLQTCLPFIIICRQEDFGRFWLIIWSFFDYWSFLIHDRFCILRFCYFWPFLVVRVFEILLIFGRFLFIWSVGFEILAFFRIFDRFRGFCWLTMQQKKAKLPTERARNLFKLLTRCECTFDLFRFWDFSVFAIFVGRRPTQRAQQLFLGFWLYCTWEF